MMGGANVTQREAFDEQKEACRTRLQINIARSIKTSSGRANAHRDRFGGAKPGVCAKPCEGLPGAELPLEAFPGKFLNISS
ncbi:Uncharacterized protein ALO91_02026 [Pseudomonas syringae pv. aceris]|uniref:Uncharacterized protein n=2 Tax=Pseudomonas syringae group TaxID=136849 RepID=A0A0P9M741_PSESX|nr:Uncharacterized protein ALO91_02026 [Pseudomonas syringae pv. aceris]